MSGLYESFEERSRVRAEAVATGVWPPASTDLLTHMQSEVFIPAPFSPKLEPRELGGLYEIRMYEYAPGSIPSVIERWSEKIGERVKLSPLVTAGNVDFGQANGFIHIWAYESMDQRLAIRNKAREMGVWPPPGGGDSLIAQANKIMLPAKFSPLQ